MEVIWQLLVVVTLSGQPEVVRVDAYGGMDECFVGREKLIGVVDENNSKSKLRFGWQAICVPIEGWII